MAYFLFRAGDHSFRFLTAGVSLSVLAALSAVPAFAQEVTPATDSAVAPQGKAPDPDQSASPSDGSDIVVTGTRVVRNGYDAPTPTTVLGAETLQTKAAATIVDALVTLPAFKNTSTASTASVGNSGTAGQSFVNLRGLGPTRTLVLLDGQRVVPSTAIATVDLAILPSALIERVDIVTGGASAAWGSDAVAGVVNFVLDNRFSGIKGDIQSGISQYGDNATYKASLAVGTDFGEHGHVVLSGEYLNSAGVFPHARPFSSFPIAAVINNTGATAANGQFKRLILPYVYYGGAAYGGVITSGPLKDTEFLPGGATGTFPSGQFRGTFQVLPGLNPNVPWFNTLAYLATPLERGSVYGRISWDIAPKLSIYATGIYANSMSGPYASTPPNTVVSGAITVRRDNAFLPQSVRDQMTALGLQTISVGRYSEDWGNSLVSRQNITKRVVAGIQGNIGGSWKIDVYGEYGQNRDIFLIANNALPANIAQASDSVVAPGGQIVCRSTLTNPNDGCVPLNIFGAGSASPAAIAYVVGKSRAVLDLTQKVAAASISGEPFSTWAGPVSLAAGAEYREEEAVQTADQLSIAGKFAIGNPKPLSGQFNVKEAFAETVIPLAKDITLLRSLDLNAAVRFTDYSTSGSVTTWKIGGNWEPFADLRFRATRSRDIRAPNLLELFTAPIQQSATVIDPVTNTQPLIQSFSVGNPNLAPEKADTTSAGVIYKPSWFPGFQASVDYYDIKVNGAIATLALQDIVNRCNSGNQTLCDLITRTNGAITQIQNPYLNLQSLSTRGLDLEASYRRKVAGGDFSIRALANRTISFKVSDGVTTIDRAGDMLTGQPKWTGELIVSYANSGFMLTADTNYIGGGKYDVTFVNPNDINDNSIPSRAYLNLQASYDLGGGKRHTEFFFNVSNVFDTVAPAIFAVTNGPNYDRIGRAFRVGFRFSR
jgi:outer membrane receptor protein involved in Fe transport